LAGPPDNRGRTGPVIVIKRRRSKALTADAFVFAGPRVVCQDHAPAAEKS